MGTRLGPRTKQRSKRERARLRKRRHRINNAPPSGICQKCGCSEQDCSQCVEAQGFACSWANRERTLCTRCEKGIPDAGPMGAGT